MSSNQKNIILHIGLYKTGSTFIQEHLRNVKQNDFKVFLGFSDYTFLEMVHKYLKKPNNKLYNDITNIINKEKSKNILISSEGLLGHQHFFYKNISKRFILLEKLFKKPKYIIFFREQSSIIYSGYFQGLRKFYDLKFRKYISRKKTDLKIKDYNDLFVKGLNYKTYDYNIIFKNYLKIYKRVLFVEYEKFFEKKDKRLINFIGLNIKFNWNKKINQSFKNLHYLEFYNKYLIFKIIRTLWIQINRFFFNFKKKTDITLRILVLINFLTKFTPKKYLEKVDLEHKVLLKIIKQYHSKNYSIFKNKLKSIYNKQLN